MQANFDLHHTGANIEVIRNMADELEIPASAFQVKASYFDRPDRATVNLIHQFIQQFGTPHLWWGHTHTAPTRGSRVTFLGKYTLPKSHHRRDRWAPCPCCSPLHPKYFRKGLIAWFPDEGVIRCVGDQCYKAMDPAGYSLAMTQLNKEIEDEKNAQFLLSRVPRIPEYLRIIEHNIPIVEAIDKVRNELVRTLDRLLAIDLWPHVNTGMLRTTIYRNEVRWRSSGEDIREIADFADFGSVVGNIAIKPGHYNLRSKLVSYSHNLQVVFDTMEGGNAIFKLTETEKDKLVKILTFAHTKANACIAESEEVRRFFSKVNASTINRWSEHENSPFAIHLAIDDEHYYVGRSSESHFSIKWPQGFWNVLQSLEPLSKALAA